MLPPTSLPALCHMVAMGKACCTTFCKQLLNVSVQTKHLALPVARVQDSYRFSTSEATILKVLTIELATAAFGRCFTLV